MTLGIILCGGKATRLRPITQTIPKALVKVRGKPIIDHQLDWLKKQGVDTVILAVHHKWRSLRSYLSTRTDINLIYSVEDEPLGTGGALKKAWRVVEASGEDGVFVINGDNISNVDLKKVKHKGSPCVTSVLTRSPYGIIRGGRFVEKPLMKERINAGIYYFDRSFNVYFPAGLKCFSLEYDVLAKIGFREFKHAGEWVTVDSKRDLDEANKN